MPESKSLQGSRPHREQGSEYSLYILPQYAYMSLKNIYIL